MYTCSKCKMKFEGDPARIAGKNYALRFCDGCSKRLNDKVTSKFRERSQQIAAMNRCKWCDSSLNNQNRSRATRNMENGVQHNSNLCIECDADSAHRRWLERCLVNSDTILNYIDNSKRRERWKQKREEKQFHERRNALPLIEKAVESQATPQNNDALKSLLLQLVDALNSVK